MDTLQQTFKLPNAKLHESDIKFVQKFCSFLSSISGKINVAIEDRFPSRFSIVVTKPPKFCLKDIKQIDMMSNNIKNVFFDMEKNELIVEVIKNGQKKPKRQREIEEMSIPDHYDFKEIEKNDMKHIKSIFGYLIALTEMEFSVTIEKRTLDYKLELTELETFKMRDVIHIHDKFSAFISEMDISFSEKKIILVINKV